VLPIIGNGFIYRGTTIAAKKFIGGTIVFFAIVIKWVPATYLGMGMNVDSD